MILGTGVGCANKSRNVTEAVPAVSDVDPTQTIAMEPLFLSILTPQITQTVTRKSEIEVVGYTRVDAIVTVNDADLTL